MQCRCSGPERLGVAMGLDVRARNGCVCLFLFSLHFPVRRDLQSGIACMHYVH